MNDQSNIVRTDYSPDPPYRIIRQVFRPGRVTVFTYDQGGNRRIDEEMSRVLGAESAKPSAAGEV